MRWLIILLDEACQTIWSSFLKGMFLDLEHEEEPYGKGEAGIALDALWVTVKVYGQPS